MQRFESTAARIGVPIVLTGALAMAGCTAEGGGGQPPVEASASINPVVSTFAPACKHAFTPESGFLSQANVVTLFTGRVVLRHDSDGLELSQPGVYDLAAQRAASAKQFDRSPDKRGDWANWVNAVDLAEGASTQLYNDDQDPDPEVALQSGRWIRLTCSAGKLAIVTGS